MKKVYEEFFRKLFAHKDDLSEYVDWLYTQDEYSENDLNEIFGVLKREGLISSYSTDDRVHVIEITFEGKNYFNNEETVGGQLIVLINKLDSNTSLFRCISTGGEPSEYETQEFQDWLSDVLFELQTIYDRSRDIYIWETINLCNRRWNVYKDKQRFCELRARLNTIRKHIEKYYDSASARIMEKENNNMKNERPPLIFISHSSHNRRQVSMLAELLRSINLQPQSQIFCSSLPGYDIAIDENIIESLRDLFEKYSLYVIIVHSPEYYTSAISMNEMGAAWALKTQATSILLPGFDFAKMTGVINSNQIAIKLDSDMLEVKDKLNQLRDKLVRFFSLGKVPDSLWEEARDKFIRDINSITPGLDITQDMIEC